MDNEFHENGRIWFLYRKYLHVHVQYKLAQMITCSVEAHHIMEKFLCSIVYAFNYEGARQSLWEEMDTIKNTNKGPWIVCGDFNYVRYNHEKIGDNPSVMAMRDFNKCLMEAELQDLKWWGSKFTWWNQQIGLGRVESKINRVLVNGEWINFFLNSDARFFLLGVSDHCPSLVYTQYGICGKLKPFKFFDMWVQHEDFINVVREGWNTQITSSHQFQVTQKLKAVNTKLCV